MDLKRIISIILGFPIVAILLIFGNKYIVDISFSIIGIIAINEYFNAFKKISHPVKWVGYLACIFIAFIHIIPIEYLLVIIWFSALIIIVMLFMQLIITEMKTNFNDIVITFFGIFYIIGFMIFIPLLHGEDNGKYLIWYILIASWGTDTFAYLVGKRIGKHKLTKVSPKKSVEGLIAGVIGSTLIGVLYAFIINKYTNIQITYMYILIIMPILSLISQMGDLAASSIKRFVDIKDFSDLIPGHGGMLDRIDSLIFIAPFAYFLLVII